MTAAAHHTAPAPAAPPEEIVAPGLVRGGEQGFLNRALRAHPAGFTYLGVLFVIAIMGAALAGVGVVWSTWSKRAREAELVFILKQYSSALERYAKASPAGSPRLPENLEDLLLDPRFPDSRRYLRKIFLDPMTQKPEWGLVRLQGRIAGVYSLSEEEPIGRQFVLAGIDFANAQTYSDWKAAVDPTVLQGQSGGGGVVPSQGSAVDSAIAKPYQPPPKERPDRVDQPTSGLADDELREVCAQFNTLDMQACSASRKLSSAGRLECFKSAAARQQACMVQQTNLPPLYLSEQGTSE